MSNEIVRLLKNFEEHLTNLKGEYAEELAKQAKAAGWQCSQDIDLYDKLIELKGVKTVLQDIDAEGFDIFALCEDAQLLTE